MNFEDHEPLLFKTRSWSPTHLEAKHWTWIYRWLLQTKTVYKLTVLVGSCQPSDRMLLPFNEHEKKSVLPVTEESLRIHTLQNKSSCSVTTEAKRSIQTALYM